MDGEPDLLGAEPAAVRLEPGVKENTVTAFSAVRAGIRQVMAARRLWLTYYVATLGFGIVGWVDDYRKVVYRNPKGLSARAKLLWQSIEIRASHRL
jgi:UDP-N-acetylmuramyl pentapeptide phosphotransferase/UDP-N-acetylglucosamine-1-phosphate transferase